MGSGPTTTPPVDASTVPLNDLKRSAATTADAVQAAVADVLASGWYVLGPQHGAFEAEFATFLGVDHVIGVASGTDALELALLGLGLEPGDEVVTAANAGGYTTTATLKAGLVPRYADVDPDTHLLTAATVQPAIGPRTRAVVVTHLYGLAADVAPLRDLCRAAGVHLVEDCAQSAGARTADGMTGSLADAATFSFFPTKNLGAVGDAGAVATGDPAVAERVRRLRQYGWTSKYTAELPRARNSRLDELQAAVLRVRLPHLAGANDRRRAVVSRYAAALSGSARRMVHGRWASSESYIGHLAVMETPAREADLHALTAAGIRTDVHYPVPDHRQPFLADQYADTALPVTERLAGDVLTLPCFPELTDDEIERVCRVLAVL